MFVFNPTDTSHGADGYSVVPDFVATVKAPNNGRSYALQVAREDIKYLNDLAEDTEAPIFWTQCTRVPSRFHRSHRLAMGRLFRHGLRPLVRLRVL